MPHQLRPARRAGRTRVTAKGLFSAALLTTGLLFAGMSGCAMRPSTGEVVHARVILRVGERLFAEAIAASAAPEAADRPTSMTDAPQGASANTAGGDTTASGATAASGDTAPDLPRTLAILGLITDGATIEDARAGRLLLTSCRWGGDSGATYAVRLPADVTLPAGDRVEIELVAGASFPGRDADRRGRFVRLLPYRATGRTHCDPEANR